MADHNGSNSSVTGVRDRRYAIRFPFAANVEDAALLFDVIGGHDPRHPGAGPVEETALLAGDDIIECDFVGYAYGARHVQRRSRRMSSMDF